MTIKQYKFPNRFLVLPNTAYFFGKLQKTNDLWKIVRTFDCNGVATVFITSIGTFGFIFPDSSYLSSIDVVEFCGNGPIPEEVMKSEDEIHILQEKRMSFINFVSASFFGRVSAKRHSSLTGAIYNGQDKISGFNIIQGAVSIQCTELLLDLMQKKENFFNSMKWQSYLVKDNDMDDAISYIDHLLHRQNDFEYADLQSCMVMNYQAAILHNQQNAAASLALNFSVIESLAREIFIDYGLVDNNMPKSFAIKPHNITNISKISKKNFDNISIFSILEILHKGAFFDDYLYQRLEIARKNRNNLMHKGSKISPKDSGDCQTIVRDLWALLVDTPFELIAGWTYLR